MNILINQTTGQIIEFKKVLSSNDGLFMYALYENGIKYKNKITQDVVQTNLNKNLKPNKSYSFNDYIENICLDTLLASLSGFTKAKSKQPNWCFKKGSTNADTLYRIEIPFALLGSIYQSGNALELFLQSLSSQTAFRTKGKNTMVCYVETLSAANQTMLAGYVNQGVIVEARTYEVAVTVHDGATMIEGANVVIGTESDITDVDGMAYIYLIPGTYSYIVTFPDATTRTGSITINADRTLNINKN